MLVRLGMKAVALVTFFFVHYVLYNVLVVIAWEVLHLPDSGTAFAFLLSTAVSVCVAVAVYRVPMRTAMRRKAD
jgi:hypothetical protein